MRSLVLAIICAFAFVLPARAAQPTFTGIVTLVSDGDTFRVKTASGEVKVRLFGIDAPEKSQTCTVSGSTTNCGQQAGDFLVRQIIGMTVTCVEKSQSYGRSVAICKKGKRDVNAMVARAGWAVPYLSYSKQYQPLTDAAKAQRIGIWQGEMETPHCYRNPTHKKCPCQIQVCTYK